MRLKIKARYIVIPIVLLLIFLVYRQFSKFMGGPPGFSGGMPPVFVEATHAQAQPMVELLQATGTLIGIDGVDIKSEVAGRITKVFFHAGDFVKKGKPLIEINPDVLKAEFHQAKAQYHLSETIYKRYKELYEKQVVSLQELDQSLADRNVNKAKMEQFKSQWDQMTVRAPLNGRVGLSWVNVGNYVQPGDLLTNIQRLDSLRVDFQIPEIYLSKLKLGLPVHLKTTAYPHIDFKGKIYEMDTKMDPQTRSVRVRAQVLNPKQQLLPGMYVEVYIDVSQNKTVFMIPNIAVAYDAQGTYVYGIKNHEVKRIPIKLGRIQEEKVEVLEGLNSEDEIVLSGQMKLHEGSKVNIIK